MSHDCETKSNNIPFSAPVSLFFQVFIIILFVVNMRVFTQIVRYVILKHIFCNNMQISLLILFIDYISNDILST